MQLRVQAGTYSFLVSVNPMTLILEEVADFLN